MNNDNYLIQTDNLILENIYELCNNIVITREIDPVEKTIDFSNQKSIQKYYTSLLEFSEDIIKLSTEYFHPPAATDTCAYTTPCSQYKVFTASASYHNNAIKRSY